jgi:hypothetical protein
MTLNKCFEKIVYHTKIYIMMKLMLLIYSRKSYIFYTIGQTLQRFTFEKTYVHYILARREFVNKVEIWICLCCGRANLIHEIQ